GRRNGDVSDPEAQYPRVPVLGQLCGGRAQRRAVDDVQHRVSLRPSRSRETDSMNTMHRLVIGVAAAAIMLGSNSAIIRASNNDETAGAWQMIVLSGPTQFSVAPPLSTTSVSYQNELQAIRNAQAQLTDAQRASIDYWSKGSVVRWNEIMIELVS